VCGWRSIKALIKALHYGIPEINDVRVAAARALGRLGDSRAVEPWRRFSLMTPA
jgi:HEAT repeat protein